MMDPKASIGKKKATQGNSMELSPIFPGDTPNPNDEHLSNGEMHK